MFRLSQKRGVDSLIPTKTSPGFGYNSHTGTNVESFPSTLNVDSYPLNDENMDCSSMTKRTKVNPLENEENQKKYYYNDKDVWKQLKLFSIGSKNLACILLIILLTL